tara:strand:- start:8374 stop:9063 length:690 start_codon:yes stop_codon:yes gene_type:complete
MQKINFKKDQIPFTQVANEVLQDPKLSAKAKGIYAYLYSKPEGWDFAIERIAQEFTDGERAIRSGIQELEANGYLYRERLQSGRVVYLLKTKMQSVSPPAETAGGGNRRGTKPQGEVLQGLSNKENKKIKKDIAPASPVPDLNALIELFEPVNPTFERIFSNTTQRKALERLVVKFGREKIEGTIRALPQINGEKYAPTITTPVQLENKLAQLIAYWKKNNSSSEMMRV